MTTLLLTITAVIAATNPPAEAPDAGELACVHVLAELTEAQALLLQGKRARFLVEPSSDPVGYDGVVLVESAAPEALHRTVWLAGANPDDDLPDLLTVEAVLVVIRHQPRDGFPGFAELRLTGARLVQ